MRKIFVFGCLAFSFYLFAVRPDTPLQDVGLQPPGFIRFGMDRFPENILSEARKYLPFRPVIVEAGAFTGAESCRMAQFWPLGTIHSFEPVREIYDKLVAWKYAI